MGGTKRIRGKYGKRRGRRRGRRRRRRRFVCSVGWFLNVLVNY